MISVWIHDFYGGILYTFHAFWRANVCFTLILCLIIFQRILRALDAWGSRLKCLGAILITLKTFESHAGSHKPVYWKWSAPEQEKLGQESEPSSAWGSHSPGMPWPKGNVASICPHGPPGFVRLISTWPMWPSCACTGTRMPGNYERAKVGLKKGSLATIRLHTLPFPILIGKGLF